MQQPSNAGSAWITGFEAAYQQQFRSLPGIWNGLGLKANYLYTASRTFDLQDPSGMPGLAGYFVRAQ